MDTEMASPDADDTTPAERADGLPPQADTAAADAIDAQYARFERIMERLSKLEFEASMQDRLWKDEVDQYFQKKVKQVRGSASQRGVPRVPWREACPELAEELDEIQAALRDTGEQVAELTQHHFRLIREKQELLQKIALLTAENEGLGAYIAYLHDRLTQVSEANWAFTRFS